VSTCSYLILFFNSIKYKIQGKNNLLHFSHQPAIYIANHSSSLDIPMLEVILQDQPKIWISKTSYTKIPIFGFILKRMHIAVDRDNLFSTKKVLTQTIELTENQNRHLLIFPEGRRFDDGKIHRFLPGFAVLAKKLNRPVIPIAIHGFNKILPKNKLCLDSTAGAAKISIGAPISHSDFATREEFVHHIQEWFEKELTRLRKE
jgi:1-acyl-sn-glycerol-3-phosphate acyltransferase